MDLSSSKTIDQFKSLIRVAAKILLRSRETQKQRATANRRTINKLKDDITKLRQENLQLKLVAHQSQSQLRSLEALFKRPENAPVKLPADLPLPHHSYGPNMIALAINIACTVGLRAAENVIKTFFDWLQIKAPIPDWTSTRQSLRPVPNETWPNTKCDSANRTGALHASLAEAEGTLYELGVAAKLGRDDSLAVVSSEVWLRTEILESSFGQYKLLERQHSKGGFTTLIAAFPALLEPCTAELANDGFQAEGVDI